MDNNVTKRYKDLVALDHLNLEIEKGNSQGDYRGNADLLG